MKEYVAAPVPEGSVVIDGNGKLDPIGRQMAVSQTYKLDALKESEERKLANKKPHS